MSNRRNRAFMSGTIVAPSVFWYEENGTRYFRSAMAIKRKSGIEDTIPIAIMEEHIQPQGRTLLIKGEYRTRPETGEDGARHLNPYIFVNDVEPDDGDEENLLILVANVGYVAPARETPQGRKVCNFRVFVDSGAGTCAVPCIAWEKLIPTMETMKPGDRIYLKGRLQSRQYEKSLPDGGMEIRTAYELSVWSVHAGD